MSGLSVRNWECKACGAIHDRDINSAQVILNFGLGTNLASDSVSDLNRNPMELSRDVQCEFLDSNGGEIKWNRSSTLMLQT